MRGSRLELGTAVRPTSMLPTVVFPTRGASPDTEPPGGSLCRDRATLTVPGARPHSCLGQRWGAHGQTPGLTVSRGAAQRCLSNRAAGWC